MQASSDILPVLPRTCPSTRRSWRFTSLQVRARASSPAWAMSAFPGPPLWLSSLTPLPTPPPGHFAHGSDRRMVRLEDLFQRFPRTPMSVEIKGNNEELIREVVLQAGLGRPPGSGERPGSPITSFSSSQIADLVRRYDRNEITIWASENRSVMKKCKAAVSSPAPDPLRPPGAPPPGSWSPPSMGTQARGVWESFQWCGGGNEKGVNSGLKHRAKT